MLVASARHPQHVVDAALIGADVITLPPATLASFTSLTDKGPAFLSDWEKPDNQLPKADKSDAGQIHDKPVQMTNLPSEGRPELLTFVIKAHTARSSAAIWVCLMPLAKLRPMPELGQTAVTG